MNDRERFVAWMTGAPVDRPPYWLMWGPWPSAWARWEREGKPAEVTDHRSFMSPDCCPLAVPVNCGPCPRIPPRVLDEDEKSITFTDGWGITRRDFKSGVSMPQFLDFPVKSRADWEEYRDTYLNPDDPGRLAGNWLEQGRDWMAKGYPIQLGYFPDVGIFGSVRWMLGDEECLMAFYTMPDIVREMMERMTDVYLAVFEQVTRAGIRVDVIHIWEDMCGKNGPLISPELFEEFMAPQYRRIKAFAVAHDIPLLSVDTDGWPDLLVGPMMRTGVNFMFPFEVAAGCDVNDYRARYPELAMFGGIDKREIAKGPAAIDRELARVRPAMLKGRYIPELDHCIPDDISWDNYNYYARALKKMAYGTD